MAVSAEAIINLDAYRHNLCSVAACAPNSQLMAVVKADAYGHGIIPIAQTARQAGAQWLGVATPDEAIRLRTHGVDGNLLCWLATPETPWAEVIDAGIEVTASGVEQLAEIIASGSRERPRVQLKVDTGLARNGAYGTGWTALVDAAVSAQAHGKIQVTGLWSHLACADEPNSTATTLQEEAFTDAIAYLTDSGIEPELCHLANSAATLTRPSSHFDLVRVGIAAYGINPDINLTHDVELQPVMTLRAQLAHVKRVPAGQGVSYGHRWHSSGETTLGLVPIGYAEGIHRAGSGQFELGFASALVPQVGTVCMDQLVVDLGDRTAHRGEWVYLFGDGEHGELDANSWAARANTIGYEVVTRLGGRITRTYRGSR